jgi:hypothetical protein
MFLVPLPARFAGESVFPARPVEMSQIISYPLETVEEALKCYLN